MMKTNTIIPAQPGYKLLRRNDNNHDVEDIIAWSVSSDTLSAVTIQSGVCSNYDGILAPDGSVSLPGVTKWPSFEEWESGATVDPWVAAIGDLLTKRFIAWNEGDRRERFSVAMPDLVASILNVPVSKVKQSQLKRCANILHKFKLSRSGRTRKGAFKWTVPKGWDRVEIN